MQIDVMILIHGVIQSTRTSRALAPLQVLQILLPIQLDNVERERV